MWVWATPVADAEVWSGKQGSLRRIKDGKGRLLAGSQSRGTHKTPTWAQKGLSWLVSDGKQKIAWRESG